MSKQDWFDYATGKVIDVKLAVGSFVDIPSCGKNFFFVGFDSSGTPVMEYNGDLLCNSLIDSAVRSGNIHPAALSEIQAIEEAISLIDTTATLEKYSHMQYAAALHKLGVRRNVN